MSSLFQDLQETVLLTLGAPLTYLLVFTLAGVVLLVLVIFGLGIMRRWTR